ncbi:MAG: hypothetical protein J2P25_21640 [Nocardiopsaceae bacterium]|nr:hypothetical protein [Nocardiopsaceae bacterium]
MVWVFRRILGDAALIELLPAVPVRLRDSDLVSGDLAALRCDIIHHDADVILDGARDEGAWHEGSPGAGDDGLTDAERARYAMHYQTTAAADLTADQMTELKAAVASGRIPRRRLRPAG